jgi:hypothetical protein
MGLIARDPSGVPGNKNNVYQIWSELIILLYHEPSENRNNTAIQLIDQIKKFNNLTIKNCVYFDRLKGGTVRAFSLRSYYRALKFHFYFPRLGRPFARSASLGVLL